MANHSPVSAVGPTLIAPSRLKPHIGYLEGLRGIAALLVVWYHIGPLMGYDRPSGTFLRASAIDRGLWPTFFGAQMVDLFLVVSGFSLFYADARRQETGKPSTYGQFFARRAWRILPIYFAALATGLVVTAVTAGSLDALLARQIERTTTAGVVSHLLLVHNWFLELSTQINGPLWTVAAEFQAYLFFPFLLPLIRRSTAVGLALCLVAYPGLFTIAERLHASPHAAHQFQLLASFLAGATVASFSLRCAGWWHRTMLGVGLALCGYAFFRGNEASFKLWILAFSLLVGGLYGFDSSRFQFLNARPFQWLGRISYSLYAFHYPAIYPVCIVTASVFGLRTGQSVGVAMVVGTLAALGVAALSWRYLEQPTIALARSTRNQ